VSAPEGHPDWRLSDRDFARASEILGRRCGLRFHGRNRQQLEEGLIRVALAEGGGTADLIDRLERLATDSLLQAVVRQITVGETYFFRHPEHFEILTAHLLPELMKLRPAARTVRAWSAGCASGEEAYSLAMALRRSVATAYDVHVLGTDINKSALETARSGRYGRWSLRGPAKESIVPGYLSQLSDGTVEVTPALRSLVRFGYLNLHDPVYPSLFTGTQGQELIFCRNVLVYFFPEAARQVLGRLAACLVDGGLLVVSAFDLDLAPPELQVVSYAGVSLLRKVRAAVRPPERPRPLPTPAAAATAAPRRPLAAAEARQRAKEAADRGELADAEVLARQAVELERTPESLHLLALVLGERGEDQEAAALLDEAVALAPDYVLGHLSLGLLEREVDPAFYRVKHLRTVLNLVKGRRDEEMLPGPDPLPVSWVRKMANAGLAKSEERR
jgi:chemotaxis protein methyltransferase CheR